MKTPTLIDLFCGAGGFSRGFWLEGFHVLLGIDSFPPVARSFKANFPEATVLAEDIKSVSGEFIQRIVGEVDVVIGGPPCFPKGTKVLLEGSLEDIENVKVGDKTYTHRGLKSRVLRVTCREYSGELVKIKVSNFDREVVLTPEHPVYTLSVTGGAKRRVWVKASSIRPGDYAVLVLPRAYKLKLLNSVSNSIFQKLLRELINSNALKLVNGEVVVSNSDCSRKVLKRILENYTLKFTSFKSAVIAWIFLLSLNSPTSLNVECGSLKRVYELAYNSRGEVLIDSLKAYLKVESVDRVFKGSVKVYNLEVERDKSYLVPPFTVHNCEAFTSANPNRMRDPYDRLYSDPTGRLVLEFIRIVGDVKPKIFVMENVPQIMESPIPKFVRREFYRVGYRQVFFNVLKAEDYSTPSHRVRVFISNIRILPEPTGKVVVVEDALRDLPPPGFNHIPNHEYTPISKKKSRRIKKLKWGAALIYYRGARGQELPNYIRLHPRKIAPTVLGSSRFIHPFEDRFLTVREQARLMGYPDYHVFLGGRDLQYNQVGESVPVPLARAIARVVIENL